MGQLFEDGEYFVSEMLIVARAMQADAAILKPKLVEQDIKPLIPAKAEAGIHADTGRKFKESIHTWLSDIERIRLNHIETPGPNVTGYPSWIGKHSSRSHAPLC